MRILTILLAVVLDVIPAGQSFLRQLQPRDSVLIADQLEYGFELDSVKAGSQIALPDFSAVSNDTLVIVRGWAVDTLKVYGKRKAPLAHKIRAGLVLAPFEEGIYELPPIPIARLSGGRIDTLVFEPQQVEVKTMPVDTATFEIHDIKDQVRYPVTLQELVPWIGLLWILAVLGILVGCIVMIRKNRAAGVESARKDPPYIVALRNLDKYRGDKFWAPEKQKTMYSGITDTLKEYIDSRFGIDAPEMTTAELFAALQKENDLTPELYVEMKELFERADFVKFAKFTATDEENAKALPVAVRFVTETYTTEIEDENAGDKGGEAGK